MSWRAVVLAGALAVAVWAMVFLRAGGGARAGGTPGLREVVRVGLDAAAVRRVEVRAGGEACGAWRDGAGRWVIGAASGVGGVWPAEEARLRGWMREAAGLALPTWSGAAEADGAALRVMLEAEPGGTREVVSIGGGAAGEHAAEVRGDGRAHGRGTLSSAELARIGPAGLLACRRIGVLGVGEGTPARVRVEAGGTVVVVERGGSGWRLVSPAAERALDQEAVAAFVRGAAGVEASRLDGPDGAAGDDAPPLLTAEMAFDVGGERRVVTRLRVVSRAALSGDSYRFVGEVDGLPWVGVASMPAPTVRVSGEISASGLQPLLVNASGLLARAVVPWAGDAAGVMVWRGERGEGFVARRGVDGWTRGDGAALAPAAGAAVRAALAVLGDSGAVESVGFGEVAEGVVDGVWLEVAGVGGEPVLRLRAAVDGEGRVRLGGGGVVHVLSPSAGSAVRTLLGLGVGEVGG